MEDGFRFKLLSSEEVDILFDKCVDFLSNRGVKVDHLDALKILEKAGARVDFDNQKVRFPKDLIRAALQTVPHRFNLAAATEKHDMIVPHPTGGFYAGTNTGAPGCRDAETNTFGNITLSYVREWAQLAEVLDEISWCAFPFASDVPPDIADVYGLKTVFENTSKHICVQPYSLGTLEYLVELAQIRAGSREALTERPVISLICTALTPFQLKDMDVEAIIQASRNGIPIEAWSLPSAGGTSPVTIGGTVLVAGIEILAMLVISQLIKPGAPVVGSFGSLVLDMMTGRGLMGSVEAVLAAVAGVQFMKEAFKIPIQIWGYPTDSHTQDGQSMIEKTLAGMLVTTAGADILMNAGVLDVDQVTNPVQLVIDSTLTGILKRVNQGVTVNEDTLAWKEVVEMVPGGAFLQLDHTMKHCRDALRPELFCYDPREEWNSKGSKDMYTLALEKYRVLKERLKPQSLPNEVQKEMDVLLKRAQENLVK
jgi:trimethylamine:corrinoid methyltransferase-like protein